MNREAGRDVGGVHMGQLELAHIGWQGVMASWRQEVTTD